MDHDELVAWLIGHGIDESAGYGHVSADQLATAMRLELDVTRRWSGGTQRGTERY